MTTPPVSRFCFVGDSLTLGVGDPDGHGWVGRLADSAKKKVAELTGYNLGIRRDTSLDVAERWKREVLVRLPQDRQGAIVFAFGTNDCLDDGGRRRVAPSETLAVSRRILTEAKRIAPALMIGPPPTADPQENGRIRAVAKDLEALCSRLAVPYFNSFDALITDTIWREEVGAGDGYHPSRGGYAALAHRLASWPAWNALTLPRPSSSAAA